MNKYQEIFERIPSVEELGVIKQNLGSNTLKTWEDLYWCLKCLCVYDTESCDENMLLSNISRSYELGLSIDSDYGKFLDLLKVQSTLNGQSKQYESVLSVLNPLLQDSEDLPDWVYYDYASAEIHTDKILSVLKEPSGFLAMLGRNSRRTKGVRRRQKAIFEDFVSIANHYSQKYRLQDLGEILIPEAEKYGLSNTNGWKEFYNNINVPSDDLQELPDQEVAQTNNIETNQLFEEEDVQPDIKGRLSEQYKEALKELELRERELEEKRLELEEKTQKLDALVKEKDALQESAKANQEEKQQMQDVIKYAEAENEKLRAEIADATKTQEGNFLLSVIEPTEQLIGHMHSFQYVIQISLSRWLKKNLPYCSDDWWDYCVIRKLSYEQRQRAYDNGYTSLNQFDLPALLRILSRNWDRLNKICFLNDSDEKCLNEMFDVRNRWAHNDVELPDVEVIKGDLNTISDFMAFLGCSKEKIRFVETYANSIDQLLSEV